MEEQLTGLIKKRAVNAWGRPIAPLKDPDPARRRMGLDPAPLVQETGRLAKRSFEPQ
jgi:hypothetical protein